HPHKPGHSLESGGAVLTPREGETRMRYTPALWLLGAASALAVAGCGSAAAAPPTQALNAVSTTTANRAGNTAAVLNAAESRLPSSGHANSLPAQQRQQAQAEIDQLVQAVNQLH
ncbi:MAG: hypothetical protein K6T31_05665, partial [Alicyclobacillus sp.]|nr:hypothetical protein [Alicyclobacillus sp.]